ncbi:MAG: transcription-repair coupling factor [Patescibacteria group bacterium]|nr:transcription-repair coupling factor [Patescibacteria group bacterium]
MLEQLAKTLSSNKKTVFTGICEQAKPYIITKLIPPENQNQPIFYFVKNHQLALFTYYNLKNWQHNTIARIFKPIEEKSLNLDNEKIRQNFIEKQNFLSDISENKPGFYVIPIEHIDSSCPKINNFEKNFSSATKNELIDPNDLAKDLTSQGYERATNAVSKGYFSKKGGLIEIFPINKKYPVRIEFIGNRIEEIQLFDPKNRKGLEKIDLIFIPPIKTNDSNGKLSDYLKLTKKAIAIINDPQSLKESIDPFSYKPYQQFEKTISELTQIIIQSFPEEKTIDLDFSSIPNYSNNLLALKKDLQKYQDFKIIIFTQEEKIIKKIFANLNIDPSEIIFEKKEYLKNITGFKSNQHKLLFLTDNEIIQEKTENKKRINEAFISELKINDFLVHEDHGICLFKGTTKRIIDKIEKEYLILEYANNDKLFLPVEYSEKITKYIGQSHPKINRLHTASWLELKSKIKKRTEIIAKDLLKIYASREKSQGFTFSADTEIQKELENSFPYQETPDQIKVIKEVKDDMEKKKSKKPMDRLICGDVGFGKTEIALRAAFKATQDKKQVAILCPTTILAKQHFDNFKNRLENFDLKIAVISRFQSKLQQQDILEKLSTGQIDIIIGTHRLLSTDIKFKDLGLLILDEEQRFGVKHKETIKKLKANIDILALSATPIPRTLNLSLSGLRDISIISTPPPGRQSVINYIKPYSEDTIYNAFKKELDRNGQIYFLHNKVQTIQAATEKIKNLLKKYNKPISVAFAHGQMPENNLEKIMAEFYDKKIDILIASSIIENGLDIPNVNTIIIDNASNFGLADLYQLKGRVGRGQKQAFAYFLYKSTELKEKARRRLEALLEAKELGSGFQLALRDLEIRGAGNILGKEQSGAVTTVGLNLYCRLLNQAIQNLKSGQEKTTEEKISPTLDLPLSAYLSEKIFPNFEKRLKLYQQITNIENINELEQQKNNLLKDIVNNSAEANTQINYLNNLFYILELKIIAQKAKVKYIKTKQINQPDGKNFNRFVINFIGQTNYEKAYQLIKKNPQWDIEDTEIKINQSDLGPDWKNSLKQSLQFFI